jgi:hypothetical protein
MPDQIIEAMANGKNLFVKDLETFSIHSGHRMHEGKNMWTFDDADYALQIAISMFGPRTSSKLQSLRIVLQAQFVNPMIPGMEMLEELAEGMGSVLAKMDPLEREPMEVICNFILLMNSHIHSIESCDKGKGEN